MSQRQQAQHELKTFFCYRCCKHRAKELLAPKRVYSTRDTCMPCDEAVHKNRSAIDARNRKRAALIRPAIPWGD